MPVHPHHADRVVSVHIITVSTSRSKKEDASGARLAEMVLAAGHSVGGTSLVVDDPDAIGRALDDALRTADAIVLTGGTGVSARDCTSAVVRARLDRVLPGFGELFRMLSYAEVGSAAMLSDALGGLAGTKPVFALPGSTRACVLAMEKLILPELAHIAGEVAKETPLVIRPVSAPVRGAAARTGARGGEKSPTKEESLATPAALAPPRQGIDITVAPDAIAPEERELPTGWRAALRALGARLERGHNEIPDALARFQPVVDVLHAAGETGIVLLPDGRRWMAYGFPDLRRNASKVVLVREAVPIAEIVAFHRWPEAVGIVAEGEDGMLPASDDDPGVISGTRAPAPYQGSGSLFAVDATGVWVLEGKVVRRWEGRALKDVGPVSSSLASLVLGWSQR